MRLSVIICTHNPRPDYLNRTLQALEAQTFAKDQWELLLVDNRSTHPLFGQVDLSWHPNAVHLREEALGLTSARLCGIRNSCAHLLVFVDDDNVLEPDYLEVCIRISEDYPFLGVWGGQQIPELEIEPAPSVKPYLGYLACRTVDKIIWTNVPFSYGATPLGAGMCMRNEVALAYYNAATSSANAVVQDRVGDQLTSCGDHDMAFTACDCGLGMGLFPGLKLTHLIPGGRLQPDYIVRLMEGNAYSTVLLRLRRGYSVALPEGSLSGRAVGTIRRTFRRLSGRRLDARVDKARERGMKRALEESTGLRVQKK